MNKENKKKLRGLDILERIIREKNKKKVSEENKKKVSGLSENGIKVANAYEVKKEPSKYRYKTAIKIVIATSSCKNFFLVLNSLYDGEYFTKGWYENSLYQFEYYVRTKKFLFIGDRYIGINRHEGYIRRITSTNDSWNYYINVSDITHISFEPKSYDLISEIKQEEENDE